MQTKWWSPIECLAKMIKSGGVLCYQIDEETILPLFIKTPKNMLGYCVCQYHKKSAFTVLFNISMIRE